MISLNDYFSQAQAYRDIAQPLENKDAIVTIKKEEKGDLTLIPMARSERGVLAFFPLLQQVLGTHQEVVNHFVKALEEEYGSEKTVYLFTPSDRISALKEGLSTRMIQQVFEKNNPKETALGVILPSFVDGSRHSGFYVSPSNEKEKKQLEHLQELHEKRFQLPEQLPEPVIPSPKAEQGVKKEDAFRRRPKM